jgi:hypothetical protein
VGDRLVIVPGGSDVVDAHLLGVDVLALIYGRAGGDTLIGSVQRRIDSGLGQDKVTSGQLRSLLR